VALIDAVIKLIRAAAVSVSTTVLSLSILFVLTRFAGVAAVEANVIATVAGIGPSYALNRRFVWKLRGRSRFVQQVLPFWIFSVAGLVASTIAVGPCWTKASKSRSTSPFHVLALRWTTSVRNCSASTPSSSSICRLK